jgi:hypothetical protein
VLAAELKISGNIVLPLADGTSLDRRECFAQIECTPAVAKRYFIEAGGFRKPDDVGGGTLAGSGSYSNGGMNSQGARQDVGLGQ